MLKNTTVKFDDHNDYMDDDWEDDDDAQSVTSKSKRGQKKIPEYWSRVVNISKDDLTALKIYELGPDLLLSNGMKYTPSRGKK